MNKNSLISTLIYENKNWREFLEAKNINIKEDQYYYIFNYGIGADFSDPVVKEARGIILDKETFNVVCWPFTKFGKYYEPYADEIDWKTAKVQEKIDGSIIKLWYEHHIKRWLFSTNSEINACNAHSSSNEYISFYDLIISADNFNDIDELTKTGMLNEDYTYIFELTGSLNRVVIEYDTSKLYHIGTRNNITGKECDIDIGIEKPKLYDLHSLDDCIKCAGELNMDDGTIRNCTKEGFVVVDSDFNRVKIKSPVYSMIHNILNSANSKIKLLELIDSGKINISDICNNFKDRAPFIKYYDFKYSELMNRLNAFVDISRKVYEMCGKDRKRLANQIKNHPFSGIAFRSLDNNLSVDELLEQTTVGKIKWISNHIKNYDPENFSYIFDALNNQ